MRKEKESLNLENAYAQGWGCIGCGGCLVSPTPDAEIAGVAVAEP